MTPIELTFSMRYLQMFAKAYHISNVVTISLLDEQPMKVEYNIGNYGSIKYYLAPRLND